MRKILAVTLLATLVISLGSCRKRRLNRDTTTAIDVSMIEGGFNDVQKVSEDAMKEENLEGKSESGFKDIYGDPDVTVSPAWPDTTWPKTITIDFGAGTTDWLGRTRKGVITITATGKYRDSAAVFTIVPSSYFVEDYKIEGTKTITNNGRNGAGNLNYTIDIDNGKITTPDGEIATWESLRNREWILGESTTFISDGWSGITDDTYSITGSASGVNRLGRDFVVTITSPLIVALDCKWVKQGTLELVPEDLDTRTVDYGSGACDNDATVEINGRTYDVKMW